MSLAIRYPDFKTLYYCFGHISDELMHHILNNVVDKKKIYFPT